jgi:hypothetical protein
MTHPAPAALSTSDAERIAHKLVWASRQMRRHYQAGGLCIAELFCREAGLDADAVDRAIAEGWTPDSTDATPSP